MPSISGVAEPGVPLPLAKTKAVVAICVVLVPTVAVGAVGVPVSDGDARGALEVSVGCTWSARAATVAVPAEAVPSIEGEVLPRDVPLASTKAVVAILVLLSPLVGVGAVGVPVSAGEASGARVVSVGWT